ncbi:MAG: hypothetical protein PF517_03660 [Salinivirgaceae bacterium]|nr:hypothetical protein [Salinivirgaceae bacterium]
MKNKLNTLIGLIAGSFLMASCGTYNSAYVDDIYYNPKSNASVKAVGQAELTTMQRSTVVDTMQVDTSGMFLSDYDDYNYADRLNKFHDDEYQGDYYEDNESYSNDNYNNSYNPWSISWGIGLGYGWGLGYNYNYNPWYNSYYSVWDPWYGAYGYPNYGYNSPYYGHHGRYGCGYYGSYYNDYYSYGGFGGGYLDDDRGSYYGPRRSGASGSPNTGIVNNGDTRKRGSTNQNSSGNSNFDLQEDLAPMRVSSSRTNELSNAKEAEVSNQSSTRTQGGGEIGNTSVAKSSRALQGEKVLSKNPPAVSRKEAVNSTFGKTTYTRTRTESSKSISTPSSRNGYTPSYTRTRTSSNRAKYNSGSSNSTRRSTNSSSATRYTAPKRTTSSSSNSGNSKKISTSTNAYKRTATPTRTTQKSSYSPPRRTSTPKRTSKSYSAPKRSSSSSSGNSRSSGSSYSAPKSSSSSSGSSRSSSSSSSSSKSSSSTPRRGR